MGLGDLSDKWKAEEAAKQAERDRKDAALTKTITTLFVIAWRIAVILTVAGLVLGWVEGRWEGVLIAVTVGAASWLGLVAVFLLAAWLQRDSL